MRLINIFDIKFFDGTFDEIVSKLDDGGCLVAPAAPALTKIGEDEEYYQAVQSSDVVIFDSGFLCILLMFRGIKVKKMSGLKFLQNFLKKKATNFSRKLFLIDPNQDESKKNRNLLAENQCSIPDNYVYIAPTYPSKNICDDELISKLKNVLPECIVINLGGGTQERLAFFIKEKLYTPSYRPIILCTGAAIAFLTGSQARIPRIIDNLYLGWLHRCLSSPRKFVPRYLSGFKLLLKVFRSKVSIN